MVRFKEGKRWATARCDQNCEGLIKLPANLLETSAFVRCFHLMATSEGIPVFDHERQRCRTGIVLARFFNKDVS